MEKPLLLIVDNEFDMARFVGDVAEPLGFNILIATSDIEFQEIFIAKKPSAIVMDIVMPGMDGIELVNWMSDHDYHSHIIFMSGYDVLYIETAKLLGQRKGCHVVGTLSKPFTAEELEPLLLQIINY